MMKTNCQTKKLGEILVGSIFVVFAVVFFIINALWQSFFTLCLLLILLKLSDLKGLAVGPSKLEAIFFESPITPEKREEIEKTKINKDLKENQETVNSSSFAHFKKMEDKILSDLQKRYGGEMKTLVHFVYGHPDKPEFRYTPDGSLQTKDSLYFFEIKYILKPELAEGIVHNTLDYLEEVYKKILPSIGDKKFIIKLILASKQDLSKMSFDVPAGIELEFYKV